MRPLIALLVTVSAGFACACFAQTTPQANIYSNEAIVWEHYDTTLHMHADGTGDRILHISARLQSEGAVKLFTVISVPFASANETGTIEYVRLHKPDGTTVETPIADAIEMPAAVTRMAPLYSDLKEKQLPVRSLAVGDVIEYQLRTVRTKAEAPGQFWGSEHFLRDAGVVLSQTLTLEVPAHVYVQVWNPRHPATPTEHDGVRTYRWSVSQLQPTGKIADGSQATTTAAKTAEKVDDKIKDLDEDADGRKLPSVAWTTFHSWPELGEWYRSLALAHAQATPAIVSRANDLTKDAKTPEEQAHALYDFVSTRTRYVGIDFGVGRFQPHAADEVLNYQYGDCKDKDTLLEALLRAKGFAVAPALIGVGIAPVPDLPSPALFNHVITTVTVAGRQIWLDSTPGFAPYQVLVAPIRDQQALVIPASAAAHLETTPAQPPYPYFERFEAAGDLNKDGLLTSHMDITLRSDNELGFRSLLQQIAPAQWDDAIQNISRALGFGGTTSHGDLRQKDATGPVVVSYDYSRPSYADWEHHRILPLFPVLEIAYIDPDKAPEHDIDQGAPRTLQATTRIRLPEGYEPVLPDAVHVTRTYATFDQTYRKVKDELVVERTVVILKQKVPKANWKDYYAFTKATGAEIGENYISLNTPDDDKSAGFLASARAQIMQGKWDDAQKTLDEVKASNPKAPWVMYMLGLTAQNKHKTDEAINDFEAELTNHPDADVVVIIQLGGLYLRQKRYTETENLLRKYLGRGDVVLFDALARTQTQSGDQAGAVATLQAGLAAHPDDLSLSLMLAAALQRDHRNDDAVALMTKLIPRCENANELNTIAYLLATAGRDLALAEETSRRGIDMLEIASTSSSVQRASDRDYGQTNILAASWDTLGFILLKEGKAAEAESYLRAAWLQRANLVIGDHLARALEALGKPAEALTINELAAAADGSSNDVDARDEVTKNALRLRQAGVKSGTTDASRTLQEMRTFHLAKTPGAAGSGTFRIAVEANHVTQSELITGPEKLRTLSASINRLEFPGASPKNSKARILRDGILFCSASSAKCEFVITEHQFGLSAPAKP